MSFMQKLRGEFVDIIEWVDDSRHTLVWRFPRYHNQIKNGAQLIVRPGQVAVFVHRGEIADVFEPGSYQLTADNLPILSTILGWKHGFDSPFKAEVYFASTRQVTELKWGTQNPVLVRDPDFGPLRIRAFGSFAVKVADPVAMLKQLVGTDGSVDSEEIHVLLRSLITQTFSDLVAETDVNILDMASNYGELSEKLRASCEERVDDEYGLSFPQMFIVNISVPEEVEQAIDARSSMNVVGDLGMYQQYRLGQAIPDAARNPASGLAAAGVGLGMGMAYAQNMTPQAGGPQGPSLVLPPPQARRWHVAEAGEALGPFTLEELRVRLEEGRLDATTQVWSFGMKAWAPAGETPELGVLFAQTPPPVPPSEQP